ncbi:MAG: UDP-N-acetylmuramoyl-L-alanine--D-glutamate ligase [Magnetococcales bacterium]|nr:UDP-N-acetylmuramoyl-L-alanine--D-glutamate ligase [Magnetococcales bacterium]
MENSADTAQKAASKRTTEHPPVAVVGLGISGRAAVDFLIQQNIPVLACDERMDAAQLSALWSDPLVTCFSGPLPEQQLAHASAVLLSPGIAKTHPGLQPALQHGTPVINDVEWMYRHSRNRNMAGREPFFIGITGTNGKSTVTTLIGEMLQQSDIPVKVGGNLGQAALSLWDQNTPGYVLELSSFQLESTLHFRPKVGVLLNVSQDHLDRYSGLDAYLTAKQNLFRSQGAGDIAVINADDPAFTETWIEQLSKKGVRIVPFSNQKTVVGGLYTKDNQLIDHRGADPIIVINLDEILMTGGHNRANAAAAAAAALTMGASIEAIRLVLKTFPGLPHRMEWIRALDGVNYYNDSKGTNVGAVIESLSSFDNAVVLIAGGRDKNSDFSPLTSLIQQRCDAVILIGEASKKMAQIWHDATTLHHASSLHEAIEKARAAAQPGGAVLLSPACTSFDMFKSFEDRGDRFREAVHALE